MQTLEKRWIMLGWGLCLLCGFPLCGYGERDAVVVRELTFGLERDGVRADPWWEARITLEADAAVARMREEGRGFVGPVEVSLLVATGRTGDLRYYRSEVTVILLESRRPGMLYFYLPPEVVRRDRLGSQPFAAMVELTVEGMSQPTRSTHLHGNLRPEHRESFRARVREEAPRNDGILQPLQRTPFWGADHREKQSRSPTLRQP